MPFGSHGSGSTVENRWIQKLGQRKPTPFFEVGFDRRI